MHPRLFELPWSIPYLGPITVYTYGVLLAAAYLLGLQLAIVRARKRQLDATRAGAIDILDEGREITSRARGTRTSVLAAAAG